MKYLVFFLTIFSLQSIASEDSLCENSDLFEKAAAMDEVAEATRSIYVNTGSFPYDANGKDFIEYFDLDSSALSVDIVTIDSESLEIYSTCSLPKTERVIRDSKVHVTTYFISCETTIYGGTSSCSIKPMKYTLDQS